MPHYTPKFHISDPGPESLFEYLDTVEANSPSTIDELRDAAADLGHSIGSDEKIDAGSVLGRLGVVDPEDQFSYTPMGDSLIDLMYADRDLFENLLHFYYYTAFDRYPEEHIYSSYTYQKFTNYLYDNAPFDSLQGQKGTIVGEVTEMAETDPDLELSYTKSGVSLSTKSLGNYIQYIRDLSPTVNKNDPDETPGFEPRGFCPPELLVLAVDHVYKTHETEYNTLLHVDDVKQEILKLCLLTEEGLTDVIEYTERTYPFFSTKHSYGLRFRLNKEVQLDDLR
jgi:hypothetical protein